MKREPLCVRAKLAGAVLIPRHPPALDALLMAAASVRDNLAPLGFGERAEIDIPLARSRCGRVYLASVGICAEELHERRHLHRRFPVAEAQAMGALTIKRLHLGEGPTRSYRIPMATAHLERDEMIWYATGDRASVEELLSCVGYLGKKRSVGLGKVAEWCVERMVRTWRGFPVLARDGSPLRPLPLDWPGLGAHQVAMRVLEPPYWEQSRAEECAIA